MATTSCQRASRVRVVPSQKMILGNVSYRFTPRIAVGRHFIAHQSSSTHEMRFLVRIRGARTPPPTMDEPVIKIPLWCE